MEPWVVGLIVTKELVCDGCSRIMRHPERYGYVQEEGKDPIRLCEECSRERGYLKWKKDEKGHNVETFL